MKRNLDQRTKGWALVDSPVPTLFFTALYLFIVWIGPKYMENRKPFKLTVLLVPYNMSMAVLNAYIAVQVKTHISKITILFLTNNLYIKLLTAATRLRYSYICEPCRQKHDPDELQVSCYTTSCFKSYLNPNNY